jgi:hypothetical protein
LPQGEGQGKTCCRASLDLTMVVSMTIIIQTRINFIET